MKQPEESPEFKAYREKMHGIQDDTPDTSVHNKKMRTIFAIFMVIVYVGVGILLYINFFGWRGSIDWMRWFIGTVMIIYGIFRAYRQIAGIDQNI